MAGCAGGIARGVIEVGYEDGMDGLMMLFLNV